MAEELKTAFSERLNHRDWIDASTKALLQEKVEEMLINIGNPDHVSSAFLNYAARYLANGSLATYAES